MANKTGRKSLKEEIQIVKYMTELAGPTFKFLQDCYNGEDKTDKKWAAEQMMKLYVKALPNEVTGEDGGSLVVTFSKEVAFKNEINESDTSASNHSEGSTSV